MAMTEMRRVGLDVFLPLLNAKVMAVPRSVALQQIRQSVNEFCSHSLYWEEDLGVIKPDPANRHGYELPLPRGVQSVGNLQVKTGGEPLAPALYSLPNPRTIVFDDAVTDDVALKMAVNLTPDGTQVPETLFNYFGEAIAAGAAKRLVMMIGRDWADPGVAKHHEMTFREGCNQAAREVREQFDSHNTQRRLDRRGTFY